MKSAYPVLSSHRWKIARVALILGFFASSGLRAEPAVRPLNILLVVADDLGLQLGCYGDDDARTPVIDRLARDGLRFETAYVSQSSCSPSRSTILTGLFPHQNGQLGLANRGYTMRAGIRTLPAMLKAVGYRTGIIGKLHVNPEDAFPFDYAEKAATATRRVRHVAEQAGEFWATAAEGQPWFLMVNYFDPHVPFREQIEGLPEVPYTADEVAGFSFQLVDTPAQRAYIAGYYDGVSRVDTGLDLLLQGLAARGEMDRTLIVFLGDNGPPFVRAKTNGTAAALHVPLIVRGPGVAVGATSQALVSLADLVPTFRAVAGLPTDLSLPGRSLLPVLQEPAHPLRDYLFAEHNAHRRDMYFPERIVRDDRFKLILNLEDERTFGIEVDGDPAAKILTDPEWTNTAAQRALQFLRNPPPEELYDLKNDPQEFTNLINQPEYREVVGRLRAALQAWRETTGDPLLDPTLRAAEKRLHTDAPPSF